MKYYINQSPANPLARIVAALVATISLVTAFFFGLVILAVVAVVIALVSLVLWLRIWWLKRTAGPVEVQPGANKPPRDYIEAEYTVVSERRD